ncbi:helix-turn-helix transcriptional regulator [Stutzerimonas frequens]|uniref:Helix-turn-helix transcriptional regulator n=1 Tax=Stutzerimonas frequens TaxID=2968969 RepID=A0ABX6XUP7_9GAMM|nr:LuxR C-terminal-related transcriptional regulator [Stutzerimonas frequens]MCQ4306041.1 LuxR C-terminal-related transcriptional regulator [Stutzerimonas frequens]PNF50309.1 helix-turn-helix transcriptional regulator [Stutzerimonas frequens]QPT17741.1 helix-turn-helix transcriptional regulator [Stutzerimonas frequens]
MSVRFIPDALSAEAGAADQLASIPRLPPAHIGRPRLVQSLLAADCRLRLICAPAGFGKTVLMSECARLVPEGTHMVWLDLGGRACSVGALYSQLSGALGQQDELVGSADTAILTLLRRLRQPLWIMLDDYPRDCDAALDACLDMLLDIGPTSVSWWVSSRRQPAWKLPRLLLQGHLCELDAEALAFTEDELERMLAAQRMALSPESFQQLHRGMEGWPAGVCLMLLGADEQALRERLVAGTPLLRDYVQREVLAGLGDEVRRALLALARMPRFSAELCDHVLDGVGSEILDVLKTRQLFIRQIDNCGEWFRLWKPLALMLQRLDAAAPTQVHLRACQWFASRGEMREAVEHALWAGQPEVAANYLQRYGQEQLLIGDNVSRFLKWRSELPQDLFASTTRLIVLQGWALIISARLDEVEDCLAELAKFFPQPDARRQAQLLAQWQALRGFLARLRGEPGARENCLQALEVLSDHAWAQRVLCYQVLTQQAMSEGKLELAQQYNSEGMKLARLKGSVLYEMMLSVDRIQLLELTGEFERAVGVLNEALQALRETVRHSPLIGRLQLLQGHLLAYQGLDEPAQEAYQLGKEETETCGDSYCFFGYVGLAELAARSQEFACAYHWLRDAERLSQWRHVPEARFRGILPLINGVAWLHQGELRKARSALCQVLDLYEGHGYLSPSGFYELLPRLRRYLAVIDVLEGQPQRAITELRAQVEQNLRTQRLGLACECRFSLAEALQAAGQTAEAETELRSALAEAARQHLVKPLYELHHRQPQWLARVLPATAKGESLRQRLLHYEREPETVQAITDETVLSNRELTVLRLIAQGCSNQEIAEQLFISLHTVKTHARRINTKLGVARRTQAVAKAKALAWL